MPRPKGSKKDKTQLNKLSPSTSNDSAMDECHWMKTVNKLSRTKKSDDEHRSPSPDISSSELRTHEYHNTRVVVNPAVLRYLEQSRLNEKNSISMDEDLFSHLPSMDIHDENKDLSRSSPLTMEDELFWDFSSISTDFLPTARLANWILTNERNRNRISMS